MKIGICGASVDLSDETLKKSYKIGEAIAKTGNILVMGAGRGYPKEAAKGAFENNGKVIGYSPANDENEHINRYNFSKDFMTDIIYTGNGIPRRNFDIVENSDAIIIIGGQIGTLNEFTIAFHMGKVIGVLEGSGGITVQLPKIISLSDKNNESENVIFSEDPKDLINKIINKNR